MKIQVGAGCFMIDHGLEAQRGAVGYDLGPCFIDLSWNPLVSTLFINYAYYCFTFNMFLISCFLVN